MVTSPNSVRLVAATKDSSASSQAATSMRVGERAKSRDGEDLCWLPERRCQLRGMPWTAGSTALSVARCGRNAMVLKSVSDAAKVG